MPSERDPVTADARRIAPQRPARLAGAAPGWVIASGCSLAVLFLALRPAQRTEPQRPQRVPLSAGGTADSNNRMVAVTGVDVTGQSILYLVDTENEQLAIYQASGGGESTQGVRLVGARNISLDLRLDGFNDKTESAGRPLPFKELQRRFQDSDLLPESPTGGR